MAAQALTTPITRPSPEGLYAMRPAVDQVVSVGDSSLWLLSDGDYEDLTATQRSRRIGCGRAAPMGFSLELPEGCRLLVGTDGVFNYARPEALVAAATTGGLDDAADQLVGLVRLPSGSFMDDLALVLLSP